MICSERNINDALLVYYAYGLYPGSFCAALLCGDYDVAEKVAHPLLADHIPELITMVDEHIPPVARDVSEWCKHGGVLGASDEIKVFLKLADLPINAEVRRLFERDFLLLL